MTVGLVLVSHSAELAEGVRALAGQMAPSVTISPAGGADGGGVGTSFDLISAALDQADQGEGAVVLYDLGSALMTAELALEMVDPEIAKRRRIIDAPFVEGAIAAAVSAEGGGSLDEVAGAAQSAAAAWESESVPDSATDVDEDTPGTEREVQIVNPLGLHARPAAALAKLAGELGTSVSVSVRGGPPVDLRSVLSVVGLATREGDVVRLMAHGARAVNALDRIAATIVDGFGEIGEGAIALATGTSRAADHPSPGAPGLAMGPLRLLGEVPQQLPKDADPRKADADVELSRLRTAIDSAAAELDLGDAFAVAHAAIVRDPTLWDAAEQRIAKGAAKSWWRAVHAQADRLAKSPDEVVASRALDVLDAGGTVLRHLGVEVSRIDESVRGAVVLADEVGPAEVPLLVDNGCAALVLESGSPTAHAVVVARGLGLPLVIRAGAALRKVAPGTTVIVDGTAGSVEVDPAQAIRVAAQERIRAEKHLAAELREAAMNPVFYQGDPIHVAANVGSLADAKAAVAGGADAVGLLRTELLVLDRDTYPSEDQQTDDLVAIFDVLGDRPTVVRVLDAGGDKPVRSLDIGPEHNGFLGVRGLRYLLEHPDLLHTQLRAICRASVGHHVSVMAPMVTTRDEARAFRTAVDSAISSLRDGKVDHAPPESVGVMVEVPVAALAVSEFAGVADFVSIGSNDLLSYLTAAERTEPGVAHLLDAHTPGFTRTLDLLTDDARRAGLPVAVCGELAGEPDEIEGLLARGVRELSMAPSRIPLTKKAIRDLA